MTHHPSITRQHAWLRLMTVLAMLLGMFAPFAQTTTSTFASSVTSAFFTGGIGTVGGPSNTSTLYAKSNGALTLTVNTSSGGGASATKCVVVSGAHTATKIDNNTQAAWTFSFTAGAGDGSQSVTIQTYSNQNCDANKGTGSASYVLDNTGPVVTATLRPAPNGAGWNKSDVDIIWTATDMAGSGVASGPTPGSDSVATNSIGTKTATAIDRLDNNGSGSVQVKLDKDLPTIGGSRTPPANANGWNNTDVTASFTCADTGGSGITGTCPAATTLSTSAANQSVSGSVSDFAGNTANATVGSINIDKVAPTLSGAPTTQPTNSWYKGDVTIKWTGVDALSGIAAQPADSTITGEGAGLTTSTSVTDKAGNTSGSVTSPAVNIDRTAPNTTVTAPPAWNNSDVTVTLAANDALSGVSKTYYTVNGSVQQTGASVAFASEGIYNVVYWSDDKAGNVEAQKTVQIKIDKTSPTIGHTQSPVANNDGWNNTQVTVSFTCGDALSGIASCTGPQTVTTEGKNQTVTGTARDNAGNTATDPAQVSIDATKPTITAKLDRNPNANGWYGADVTATYSSSDALSGIKSVSPVKTFGEGADQSDTGTANDAAGNSASVTVSGINVDLTAPTINGKIISTPNANSWFSGDVTVQWTCADNLSGVVACPANSTVSGEGGNLSVSQTISDKASRQATGTVDGIKIDRTKPSTEALNVPTTWQKNAVTVGLHATDNLSDIDATFYTVDNSTKQQGSTVTIGAEGTHTVSYYSIDKAGNTEAPKTFTVKIDLSSPAITSSQSPAQNANGWNNDAVIVSFACEDQTNLSGVAACEQPRTVTTEGKAQQVTGTTTDNAGNSTTGTAIVNIDKIAPTITGAPDRAANAEGWYKDDVTVSFDGKDELSGIDSVTGPVKLGEGKAQSVSGTAVDAAGNSASTTVSGINVDKTNPTLSAAPTTLPNTNGWYNTDVTLDWACGDNLSGVAGECPANTILDSEGKAQVASASISDVAGNSTSATSEPVKIDKTAPRTDVSAPSGWVNNSVDVTLAPYDALSGVQATYYQLDNNNQQQGTTVTITSEGVHKLAYWTLDNAGNAETVRSITIQIDKSDPTISHTQEPAKNKNGWNKTDVTVTFTCDDQATLSGIASCTTSQTVTAEGKDQKVTGEAKDNAGNIATDPATVSIDKTAPTIIGSRTPAANTAGWNNTDVTVHFDGSDSLSGIATVTADTTFGEGASQLLDGTAVDAAGNSASATVGGINVDKTAPTIAGNPVDAANTKGWYKGDVAIKWTCGDNLSGVATCPSNSTITGEGAGLKDTATATDEAGNSSTADSKPVNIDRTAPVTGADAPGGWNNRKVTVSLAGKDGLSGVDATYYSVDNGTVQKGTTLTIETEGVHTLTYWSVDEAGNAEVPKSVEVKIDLTKPIITHIVTPAPNAKGWNNSSVTVAYDCKDALSGVASCSPEAKVTTDGESQAAPGTAVDNAGNSATDDAKVSIDTAKPSITGTPDRAANDNGWYDNDVTVSFDCKDALSGIAACPAPAKLGEGKAQSAEGTATDTAGNSQDVTVSPINVDKTAPTLSGAATSEPNAAGWYNGDVTIKWTAGDNLSGIATQPADSKIESEGANLTTSTSVEDLAGNGKSAVSPAVKIDRTAPSTTVSDVSDWTNTNVTVKLTPTDNLSGVASTYSQLDNAPAAQGTTLTIATEGVHTLQVWSVDNAGNVEAQKNIEVKIDRTAPGISHTQAPAANGHHWNNTQVTVTFTCTDSGSGIASCTTPQTVKSNGKDQPVLGEATDKAGNSATDPATVSIDAAKPTVSGRLSTQPNANKWFNADVTATFTCADQEDLSGVLSCPASKILGEGANQSASGIATDAADNNSDEYSITGVNVDKTDPTLSGAASTTSWTNKDVTVTWTCDDNLSGVVSCPAPRVVTGEGANLSANASVSDKAGNTKGAMVSGINIDRTVPKTEATAPSGWQNKDVTVSFKANDNLSGVAGTYYTVDGGAQQAGTSLTVSTDGTHQVAYWSVDNAGNAETAQTVTVLVDKTAPTISGKATTAPNANGWYNVPVTLTFDCKDATSGIADCTGDTAVSTQGEIGVTGNVTDNAGNKGTTTVSGIKIDTVAPTISSVSVDSSTPFILGKVPAPTCTATDITSGLDASGCKVTISGGNADGVGTFSYMATATDLAGNLSTKTGTYKVEYNIQYGTAFFLQPINDTAHMTGVSTSVFKAGQTIPVKFQLKDANGNVITTAAKITPVWIAPVKGSSTAAAVNESAYSSIVDSGSTFRFDGTQYIYNWQSPSNGAGFYWRIGVTLGDGKTYAVNIGLR